MKLNFLEISHQLRAYTKTEKKHLQIYSINNIFLIGHGVFLGGTLGIKHVSHC